MNRLLLCLLSAALLGTLAPALHAQQVDYLRDVKPLLAKNCSACHGAKVQKAGLRLDTAAAVLKGGRSGPAVEKGKPAASLLLRAVSGAEGVTRMPYRRDPLDPKEIAVLKAWIEQGAVAPEDEPAADAPRAGHWAFQPVRRPELPAVAHEGWVRNPIDRFILARLEQEGLEPSPEADRVTLIRRLSLDLLGLPPSIEQVEQFLLDNRPDAYERLVDRLLESPHYGERWARHWLDLARYADSNGFNIDAPREIWPYRDWVIGAFNSDMPFDEFVVEQIAGDMLPGATLDQRIATGFHRNTLLNQEGGIDVEQYRVENVVDRVSTTGTVFLGLTLGCARCHDHKFDPISQKEFYEFFAFLNNADEPTLQIGTPEQMETAGAVRAQLDVLEKELEEHLKEWLKTVSPDERKQFKPEVQAALMLLPEQRDPAQKRALAELLSSQGAGFRERIATIDALAKRMPTLRTTLVMRERATPRETHVNIKGDFTRPGERVYPAVPAVLHNLDVKNPNRLDLARWLVDPKDPLIGRVTVNRFWQRFFGKGLVETENDFGTQGTPPSHPELLDWLAAEFMAPTDAPGKKWSVKQIHRLIVTSATYRQSSHARPDAAKIDPRNKLLARQARFRLEAEIIRDEALSASGLLSHKIGGPSVFPPQPPGAMSVGQMNRAWETSTGEDRYRRGMYTFFWRATPYPGLMVFDAPDSTQSCTRRNRSNTPLQALTLLNDEAFVELAQGLARRVLAEALSSDRDRAEYAFRLCLARRPDAAELRRLVEFVEQQGEQFRAAPTEAAALAPAGSPPDADQAQLAAWTVAGRALMNLDEFITRE